MTYGSLFSGIGGIDLGLDRAGWTCRWQVEIDPFCRRVLAKHWPDVPRYEDVRDVGAHNLESVDLIAGGFPCQPVSSAGERKAQDDDRWLWPEFARILCELRPRYALVENVPGLLVRGFGDVLGDLAALGYAAEWDVLRADAFGLPHRRERVFLVAYADPKRLAGWIFGRPRLRTKAFSEAEVRRLLPGSWTSNPPYGVSERLAHIGAPGNAVVPQVAEWIGRRILTQCSPERAEGVA